MHVYVGDAVQTSSASSQTSKSLLTSLMTLTTRGVTTSGRRENSMTSPVNNFTGASSSTLRATATSVASTSKLVLGRTTDTSTTSQSFTFSPVMSFDNRSSPVNQTSPHSSARTTTTRSDVSKFITEYSLSPNRTSSSETEAFRSPVSPVTDIEATNNVTISLNRTIPPGDVIVTSLPLYAGNASFTSQTAIIDNESTTTSAFIGPSNGNGKFMLYVGS